MALDESDMRRILARGENGFLRPILAERLPQNARLACVLRENGFEEMSTETLIQNIVDELRHVAGAQAIVLGGSRARGAHTPQSDIDLGIYYDPREPLDVAALAQVAARLDDERRSDLVTPIGGWGPWINGGGWLRVQSVPVDFLYKDLSQICGAIDQCLAGKTQIFYQPGHPNGFLNSIYLAEVAVCQPLWDPRGVIAQLKNKVIPYPIRLQTATINMFAWEIDFSIDIAKKSIPRRDVAYAAGCCFRSVMCMAQVLFALNKHYWLNEKGAVTLADSFEIKPARFKERVNAVFAGLGPTPENIGASIAMLAELSAEIKALLPAGV
jgi:predicted nucleotidyltransferase